MKEHLQVVLTALDKANKSGVFNLQESNSIIQSYSAVENGLKEVETLKQEAEALRIALKKAQEPVGAKPEGKLAGPSEK